MEGGRLPFEILPKEIWEMIILEVKDSEDVQNLMKASNQLNDSFLRIHHLWLLDKVLPFLIPTNKSNLYLGFEDLKSLRLVDKRWCGAVYTFLQNQPCLRPYNKSDDKVNSEAHIWSDRCLVHETFDSKPIGSLIFDDYDKITKFSEDFKDPEMNPFPSRSIIGYTKPDNYVENEEEEEEEEECQIFWEEIRLKVFEKFGKHIHFLKMKWDREPWSWFNFWSGPFTGTEWWPDLMWEWIVNSLSSLPNLKGLHLHFLWMNDCSNLKKLLKSHDYQLPSLPFLESLKITYIHDSSKFFTRELVSKYCLQLKRLQLGIVDWDCENWRFPNLTDLYLEDINMIEKITKVLESLEAPQLTKLQFNGCGLKKLKMERVFRWIGLFPSLLYLDISCWKFISESGALKPPQDSKLSLKYLKIHNSPGINYNFLRCLPNLHRIQINIDEKPIVLDSGYFNIWELSPKLKIVFITYQAQNANSVDFEYDKFDRPTYENLRNKPETGTSVSLELRSDVRNLLGLSNTLNLRMRRNNSKISIPLFF